MSGPRGSAPDDRPAALAARREAIGRTLAGRFWLRFHASVLVGGTFATGFLANAAMLKLPVHSVWLRWPLAVLAGYAAFFALVRLWLAYVGVRPLFGPSSGAADRKGGSGGSVDLPSGGGRGGGGTSFGGGGGGSGGGGASAAFDAPGSSPGFASVGSSGQSGASTGLRSAGGWLGSGSGKGGGSFGDLGGGDGCLAIVLGLIVLALVAALVGGAVHLIWIAPDLLSDAAFGAMLSAGAIPGLHRAHEPDWGGRVFRATLPVLAAVLAVVLVAAWAFTHYFPASRTIGEAYRSL